MAMPSPIDRRRAARGRDATATFLLLVAALVAACAGAATTPEPTPKPTPTPVGPPVTNPTEAAARVLATDPRFAGAMEYSADVIGASKWWTASPLEGGGYTIEVTIGWGDCPAGCIERHVWTYEVGPDGTVKLVSESGPEVPPVLPG